MGAAGSVPDYLDKDTAKALGGDLYSDDRFEANIDANQMLPKDKAISLMELTDCFLSHDWGLDQLGRNNHERVGLIKAGLKSRGLIVWFDEERLNGNLYDQMSRGIDNASVIIVFVTKRYIEKVAGKYGAIDNCRLEFSYSGRKKGATKMIPVIMEDQVCDVKTWWGELGFVLGSELYVSFTSNNDLESVCDALYQRIAKISQPLKLGHVDLLMTPRPNSLNSSEPTKPLVDLSIDEVCCLLDHLNFSKFKPIFIENEVDGTTLKNCDTSDDIVSLGMTILPKAKSLLTNIQIYKSTGVPLRFLVSKSNSPPVVDPLVAWKAIEELSKLPIHRGDRDRGFVMSECWLRLYKFDWERKPKNFVNDADKSVLIGLSELSSTEDPGRASLLLIKHFDTEKRFKAHSWEHYNAHWGIALTADEAAKIIADIESSPEKVDTLIHREPWLENEDDRALAAWMQETRWLLEGGKVVGITASVKCSQDVNPTVCDLRFAVGGGSFVYKSVTERQRPFECSPQELWEQELQALELPSPINAVDSGTTSGAVGVLMSYEQVSTTTDSVEGFGSAFQCDLWTTNGEANYIAVTTARENPTCWHLRIQQGDRRSSIVNSGSFTPKDFNKLGYQAALSGETEVALVDVGDYKITGLVHIPSKVVYALKATLPIENGEGKAGECVQYLRLEYKRVQDSHAHY